MGREVRDHPRQGRETPSEVRADVDSEPEQTPTEKVTKQVKPTCKNWSPTTPRKYPVGRGEDTLSDFRVGTTSTGTEGGWVPPGRTGQTRRDGETGRERSRLGTDEAGQVGHVYVLHWPGRQAGLRGPVPRDLDGLPYPSTP